MKSIFVIGSALCLLASGPIYAKHNDTNPCRLLELDITNATSGNAKLSGDPQGSIIHGYIERRGQAVIPQGQTSVWKFHENPFTGPTGSIVYTWEGKSGTEFCKINYDQSFCGPMRAGTNTTRTEGNCFVINDHTKPSLYWHLSGESQITLGERY